MGLSNIWPMSQLIQMKNKQITSSIWDTPLCIHELLMWLLLMTKPHSSTLQGKHLIRRETQQGDTKGQILINLDFSGVLRSSGVLYQCGWLETEGREAPAFCSNKSNKQNNKHACLLSFGKTKVPVSMSLRISTCGILSWISKMKDQFLVINSLPSEQETATRCSLAMVCNH